MLQRLRCHKCGATLLFHEIEDGVVEIKCRQTKCRAITRFKFENGVCQVVEESLHDRGIKNTIARPAAGMI